MVVIWLVCNAILAMAVSEAYGLEEIGTNYYLSFILWSVASLALFRAMGSSAFLIVNVVNAVLEGKVRFRMKAPRWMGGVAGKWEGSSYGSRLSDKLSGLGRK